MNSNPPSACSGSGLQHILSAGKKATAQ